MCDAISKLFQLNKMTSPQGIQLCFRKLQQGCWLQGGNKSLVRQVIFEKHTVYLQCAFFGHRVEVLVFSHRRRFHFVSNIHKYHHTTKICIFSSCHWKKRNIKAALPIFKSRKNVASNHPQMPHNAKALWAPDKLNQVFPKFICCWKAFKTWTFL